LATTSGNDPLSPSRQLGCDTCRISGQIGCRPAARTQRVRINSPVPPPGGTVGKNRIWSGVRESNPPHLLGRQRPKAARPTPLREKSRDVCVALRLPVSMRRIVACAGLWAGVFGWFESVDPRSLCLSAPGLAPEARPIRTRYLRLGPEFGRVRHVSASGYGSPPRCVYRGVF